MEHGVWSDEANYLRFAANKVSIRSNGRLTTDHGHHPHGLLLARACLRLGICAEIDSRG